MLRPDLADGRWSGNPAQTVDLHSVRTFIEFVTDRIAVRDGQQVGMVEGRLRCDDAASGLCAGKLP